MINQALFSPPPTFSSFLHVVITYTYTILSDVLYFFRLFDRLYIKCCWTCIGFFIGIYISTTLNHRYVIKRKIWVNRRKKVRKNIKNIVIVLHLHRRIPMMSDEKIFLLFININHRVFIGRRSMARSYS